MYLGTSEPPLPESRLVINLTVSELPEYAVTKPTNKLGPLVEEAHIKP